MSDLKKYETVYFGKPEEYDKLKKQAEKHDKTISQLIREIMPSMTATLALHSVGKLPPIIVVPHTKRK